MCLLESNKNVYIEFNGNDTFMENPLWGMLKANKTTGEPNNLKVFGSKFFLKVVTSKITHYLSGISEVNICKVMQHLFECFDIFFSDIQVISAFFICQTVNCFKIEIVVYLTMVVTCGARHASPSRAPEFSTRLLLGFVLLVLYFCM